MARRHGYAEPDPHATLRALRAAVRDAKAAYHDAKRRQSAEDMAFYSQTIHDTMAALTAAERDTHG